jgi:hypothetical protein
MAVVSRREAAPAFAERTIPPRATIRVGTAVRRDADVAQVVVAEAQRLADCTRADAPVGAVVVVGAVIVDALYLKRLQFARLRVETTGRDAPASTGDSRRALRVGVAAGLCDHLGRPRAHAAVPRPGAERAGNRHGAVRSRRVRGPPGSLARSVHRSRTLVRWAALTAVVARDGDRTSLRVGTLSRVNRGISRDSGIGLPSRRCDRTSARQRLCRERACRNPPRKAHDPGRKQRACRCQES